MHYLSSYTTNTIDTKTYCVKSESLRLHIVMADYVTTAQDLCVVYCNVLVKDCVFASDHSELYYLFCMPLSASSDCSGSSCMHDCQQLSSSSVHRHSCQSCVTAATATAIANVAAVSMTSAIVCAASASALHCF
jgi:hypothetical protein